MFSHLCNKECTSKAGKQFTDHPVPVIDHQFGDPVALCLLIVQIMNTRSVEADDVGHWHGEQDGRVGDDNVLGAVLGHFRNPGEERQLPLRGERRLGFIHDEKAWARESRDEMEEALSVGLLMKRPLAEHRAIVPFILDGLGRHVVEALRPEEKPSPWTPVGPLYDGNGVAELGIGVVRGETVVQASAFRIEPVCDGDGFQQGGLAAAVLAHEECDRLTESEFLQQADGRNPCQV